MFPIFSLNQQKDLDKFDNTDYLQSVEKKWFNCKRLTTKIERYKKEVKIDFRICSRKFTGIFFLRNSKTSVLLHRCSFAQKYC